MELLQLRYFKLAAETQNMTQAAEKLNIAQPAVSRSIKRLEEEIGVQLFDRIGKRIYLNDVGKHMYKKTVVALELIDRIPEELRQIKNSGKVIRIKAEAASAILPELLAEYKHLYPDTELQMNQDNLLSSEKTYDIRITSFPGKCKKIKRGEILYFEEIKLLLPKRFWKNKCEKTIQIDELQMIPFLGLKTGSPLRQLSDQFAKKRNFKPKYVFESDNPSVLRTVIPSGMGAVFFPEKTWGDYNDQEFILLKIEGSRIWRTIVIEKDTQNQRVAECYNFLKEGLLSSNFRR